MFRLIKHNKFLFGAILVIIVGVGSYIYFYLDEEFTQTVKEFSGEGEPPDLRQAGSQVRDLLARFERVKFDSEFFDDPAYQSLRAFGFVPAPKEQGTEDPFAPLEGEPSSDKDLIPKEESLSDDEGEEPNVEADTAPEPEPELDVNAQE